jgi:hypothetical protein
VTHIFKMYLSWTEIHVHCTVCTYMPCSCYFFRPAGIFTSISLGLLLTSADYLGIPIRSNMYRLYNVNGFPFTTDTFWKYVSHCMGLPSSNNKILNARLLARVITGCHYACGPKEIATTGHGLPVERFRLLRASCSQQALYSFNSKSTQKRMWHINLWAYSANSWK